MYPLIQYICLVGIHNIYSKFLLLSGSLDKAYHLTDICNFKCHKKDVFVRSICMHLDMSKIF